MKDKIPSAAAVLLMFAFMIGSVYLDASRQGADREIPPEHGTSSGREIPPGHGTSSEFPRINFPVRVTYSVTGQGRAKEITYTDSYGGTSREDNVPLPWTKKVTIFSPGGGMVFTLKAHLEASENLVRQMKFPVPFCTIRTDSERVIDDEGFSVPFSCLDSALYL